MSNAAESVADVLVKVTELLDNPRARNAFVLAKNVRSVFRAGESPLDGEAPFIDEPEAVELMKEIMAGVEKIFTRRSEAFENFKSYDEDTGSMYTELIYYIKGFLENPNDESHIEAILMRDSDSPLNMKYALSSGLSELQSKMNFALVRYQGNWRTALVRKTAEFNFERAESDDWTWGFEAAAEFCSALLALQRVAIEVLRRAMVKGIAPTLQLSILGHKFPVKHSQKYSQGTIDGEEHSKFKEVDKCVEVFFKATRDYWSDHVGDIHKLDVNLHNAPPNAISHNGVLYWSSSDGKLQKLESGGCQDVCTNLKDVKQLASHKGRLYCIAEKGRLHEVDVDTGRSKLVLDTVTFSNCVSMVSLGDYLYLTLDTHLYNFYRVNPSQSSEQCTCLGSNWQGARLASLDDAKYILYARYRFFLSDSVYSIQTSTLKMAYKNRTNYWPKSRAPNLVNHGRRLYTIGRDGELYSINPYYFSSGYITERKRPTPSAQVIPMASHGMSLVCQLFNDWRYAPHNQHRCYLAIVRPYWVGPPDDWVEKRMTRH